MCGRFVVARATGDLVGDWAVDDVEGEDPAPSWNVAPTTTVRMVADRRPRDDAEGEARRVLTAARWGIVPPWAKSLQGPPLINARVETVTEKPTFRKAVLTRRAVVPADGYYEWQVTASGKQPVYLHSADEGPLAFAAVYEHWRDPRVARGRGDDGGLRSRARGSGASPSSPRPRATRWGTSTTAPRSSSRPTAWTTGWTRARPPSTTCGTCWDPCRSRTSCRGGCRRASTASATTAPTWSRPSTTSLRTTGSRP
jgi:hypothetical protein